MRVVVVTGWRRSRDVHVPHAGRAATEPPAAHRARLFRFVFSDTSFCCRSCMEEEQKMLSISIVVREENKGRPLTHLDLVRAQRALAALLLEALLDALEDLVHEVAVVDAEEVRELRRAPPALLERRLGGRRGDECADVGRERGDGDAGREGAAPFRLGRRRSRN